MPWNKAPALSFQEHERTVIRDFWTALKEFAGRLPFVEDLVALPLIAYGAIRVRVTAANLEGEAEWTSLLGHHALYRSCGS